MKIIYWWIMGLAISLAVTPAGAATVVKHHGKQDKAQTVLIEGDKVRMESSKGRGDYTLIYLTTKKVFMVDERNKRVIKMGVGEELPPLPPNLPSRDKSQKIPEVDAKLVKLGAGPEILNYATEHYQIVANEVVCSDEYFSETARSIAGLENFINTLAELAQDRKQKMGQMPMPLLARDPCMQAREKLEGELVKLGVPMRSTDNKGRVMTEVVSIETDMKVDAEQFDLPKDYPVMTEKEVVQAMEQASRQQMADPRLEPPENQADKPQYRPLDQDR